MESIIKHFSLIQLDNGTKISNILKRENLSLLEFNSIR